METSNSYIPALGLHWLTPLYDPLMHQFLHADALRDHLVMESDILPGMRVLDLGCGTGSLTILIKQSHVLAQVYGLDADPQVLGIARSKADRADTRITLEQGMAYQLPYPNAWFDRVLSSLVLHHLTTAQKQLAMHEVYRILHSGGKFAILDFGVPSGTYAWLVSQVVRRTERADDNIRGNLPGMMKKAGFTNVFRGENFSTIFGTLSILIGEKH